MRSDPGVDGFASRLALAQEAVKQLIDNYEALGDVNILIAPFSSTATNSGWYGGDDAAGLAYDYLGTLVANGGTSYTDAVNEAMNNYGVRPGDDAGDNSDYQNLVYFLSDGEPNSGLELSPADTANWETFLQTNDISSSLAVGVGSGVTTTDLEDVAWPNNDPNNPMSVDDADLISALLNTVAVPLVGDILVGGGVNAEFGADTGYVPSIAMAGVTYTYNQTLGTLTESGTGRLGTFGFTTGIITLDTNLGATLEFNFDNSDFSYAPPVVTGDQQDLFSFTLIDGDGDLDTGDITFNVNDVELSVLARDNVVLTNIVDGSQIRISGEALLANDANPNEGNLEVSDATAATGGASVDRGDVVFTPGIGINGTTTNLEYEINNGTASNTDTADISVEGVAGNAITGTNVGEILIAGAGDDTLDGGGGRDYVSGGAGDDILIGGGGDDILIGGAGDDTLQGDDGYNIIEGGAGNDVIIDTDYSDINVIKINFYDVRTGVDTVWGFDNLPADPYSHYQDKLDISDVLTGAGYDDQNDDIADFVNVTVQADGDVSVSVDTTGAGINFTEVAVLKDSGQNGDVAYGPTVASNNFTSTSLQQMLNDGVLVIS